MEVYDTIESLLSSSSSSSSDSKKGSENVSNENVDSDSSSFATVEVYSDSEGGLVGVFCNIVSVSCKHCLEDSD